SLLTGRFASRSAGFQRLFPPGGPGNIVFNTSIGPDEPSLAKSLQELGYATGVVGKWHNFLPGPLSDEVDREIPENAAITDPAVARRVRNRYELALKTLREGYGFDFVDRINIGNTERYRPEAIRGQNLEWHLEGALDFLKQHHHRPFFLYFPLPVPHGQYFDLRHLNPLATVGGMLDKAPQVQPSRESIYQRLDAAGIKDPRNAMAIWMDDTIGALLKALDSYKVAENTVVLFISDNPSRGKNSLYEGARVPGLIRWPGVVKRGTVVDSLCANLDVPATLIEAAGGSPPDGMLQDGRSFLPQLKGKREPAGWRDQLLLEVHNTRAVVNRRWKYIANRAPGRVLDRMSGDAVKAQAEKRGRTVGWSGGTMQFNALVDFPGYFDADQLYDLESDLFEQKNLAGDSHHAAALAEMRRNLSRALAPLPHTFGEFKTA
ncbi:MAG TPA: sulfatase-like hydrolase/transferase, partial [Bryobacteraceae bacterium]|nr:sulfatase-like hydrolase/transferase [Bryobacteraceae bacterium]